MKKLRAIALILFVGACAFFLAYRFSQSPGPGQGGQESPQTTDAHCNKSLWQYVYNPGRLQVLNPCISVTGAVEEVRKEADGDVHILFHLDQQFASLLNEKNISRQQGDLILEPICQGKVSQPDAEEPCSQDNGPYLNLWLASAISSGVPTSTTPTMVGTSSTPSLPCSPSKLHSSSRITLHLTQFKSPPHPPSSARGCIKHTAKTVQTMCNRDFNLRVYRDLQVRNGSENQGILIRGVGFGDAPAELLILGLASAAHCARPTEMPLQHRQQASF